MNELLIPPAAQRDAESLELMRAWLAEDGLHCSLNIGTYRDQGVSEELAWGMILADAARHVANALSASSDVSKAAALDEIRHSFDVELDNPTSDAPGAFVG